MSEAHAPPSAETIARGYEPTAVQPKYFLVALIVFVLFSIALAIGLLVLMHGLSHREAKRDEARRSPWSAMAPLVPPRPWLQPSVAQGAEPHQPWQDMEEFRESESRMLDSYGSVDASTGAARIPIDRAMHILADRGVPTSQPAGGAR